MCFGMSVFNVEKWKFHWFVSLASQHCLSAFPQPFENQLLCTCRDNVTHLSSIGHILGKKKKKDIYLDWFFCNNNVNSGSYLQECYPELGM